jgi:hypothetical protein
MGQTTAINPPSSRGRLTKVVNQDLACWDHYLESKSNILILPRYKCMNWHQPERKRNQITNYNGKVKCLYVSPSSTYILSLVHQLELVRTIEI